MTSLVYSCERLRRAPESSENQSTSCSYHDSELYNIGMFSDISLSAVLSLSSEPLARFDFLGDEPRFTVSIAFFSGRNNVSNKAKITKPAPKRNGAPVPNPYNQNTRMSNLKFHVIVDLTCMVANFEIKFCLSV